MADDISRPEFESLRADVIRLRQELVDARVERAAKHLEWMRNWMSIYTPTVTLAFIIFAALGYKGLSDIDANRIKVEAAAKQATVTATQAKATAGQAETLVKDVNSKFESASQGEKQFQNQVQENKSILSGFQSSLSELQARDKELKVSGVELQNQMRDLSIEVKKLQARCPAPSRSPRDSGELFPLL